MDSVSPEGELASKSTFYKNFMHNLQFFLKIKAKGKTPALKGKAALNHLFSELEAKYASDPTPEGVTLADIEVFQRYRWMLTDPELDMVHTWTTKVCASDAVTGGGSASASSASAACGGPSMLSVSAEKGKAPSKKQKLGAQSANASNKAAILKMIG